MEKLQAAVVIPCRADLTLWYNCCLQAAAQGGVYLTAQLLKTSVSQKMEVEQQIQVRKPPCSSTTYLDPSHA